MQSEKNEMYVYLKIDNLTVDPGEITIAIGLKPTEVARKGDLIANTKLKCKTNYWKYRVDVTSKFDLETALRKLFRKFTDTRRMKAAISKGRGEVVCVLFTSDTQPTITISPELIAKVAELNCGFWLDYYILPPAE